MIGEWYKLWNIIRDEFDGYPSQLKVIKKLLSLGLSVKTDFEGVGRIYCGNIEIKPNMVARAAEVDRRVVLETIKRILKDERLSKFFGGLRTTAAFGSSATFMGYGVVEIVPESATRPGIISDVLKIISDRGINIRQVIADDPDLVDSPTAVIVTESAIPPEIIPSLKAVSGVKAVSLL